MAFIFSIQKERKKKREIEKKTDSGASTATDRKWTGPINARKFDYDVIVRPTDRPLVRTGREGPSRFCKTCSPGRRRGVRLGILVASKNFNIKVGVSLRTGSRDFHSLTILK